MQTGPASQAEKRLGQMLQFTGAQGFRAAAAFVTAVKQPVEVLLDKTITGAHGTRIAEQEQNTYTRFDVSPCDALQQAIEQFDRRCFVTVNAR